MIRRQFITLAGSAAVWPLAVHAQQATRPRRIGVLTNTDRSDVNEQSRLAAFREALRKLGWIEKKDVQLEHYWTVGSHDLVGRLAPEIVASKPDMIFIVGTTTVSAVLKHTRSIPIVFVTGADPVQVGFVKSLANPGGNATGVADFESDIGAKWLQLLKEIAPTITRVIFLHSNSRASLNQLPAVQRTAASSGVSLIVAKANSRDEIEKALGAYAGQTNIGLIVAPASVMAVNRKLIIAQAIQYRFPAMFQNRRYSADGGLMSYGVDRVEQYRRAASYVDRILKGAEPSVLPVRQSEKFELVLNLKTAKALGLTVPRVLLARADELLE